MVSHVIHECVMRLTSDAFDDGAAIPERYGYRAENVNPPLAIENPPEGAETLALVVDDPDAVEPAGTVWDHWVVWNLPVDRTEIPVGFEPADVGGREGTNDYGEVGYGGPNPPDREHTYRFVAYALDTTLDLASGATKADLEAAIEGHVLSAARLTGTYAP
jgi:Raf kinase inhibitor-like YbhB/YbcL family protein